MKRVTGFAGFLAAIALGGCDMQMQPAAPSPKPTTAPIASSTSYLSKSAVRNDAADGASAVESALALSDKQTKLTDELLRLQQERQQVEAENRRLTLQVAKLQNESEAAAKDLAQANQMLVEMRQELDAWKTNVLGFRDEIRTAQKAQLEAMKKVLSLLGAEMPPGSAPEAASTQAAPANAAAPSAAPINAGQTPAQRIVPATPGASAQQPAFPPGAAPAQGGSDAASPQAASSPAAMLPKVTAARAMPFATSQPSGNGTPREKTSEK